MKADPLTMEKNAHDDLVRSPFPSQTAGKAYSFLVRALDEILTRLAQTLNYPPAYLSVASVLRAREVQGRRPDKI